jgi:hypothetical protein
MEALASGAADPHRHRHGGGGGGADGPAQLRQPVRSVLEWAPAMRRRPAAPARPRAWRGPAGASPGGGADRQCPHRLAAPARSGEGGPAAPALVVGMPVGFVGVAESKRRLAASGLAQIRLEGSKGGAGLAAAACERPAAPGLAGSGRLRPHRHMAVGLDAAQHLAGPQHHRGRHPRQPGRLDPVAAAGAARTPPDAERPGVARFPPPAPGQLATPGNSVRQLVEFVVVGGEDGAGPDPGRPGAPPRPRRSRGHRRWRCRGRSHRAAPGSGRWRCGGCWRSRPSPP